MRSRSWETKDGQKRSTVEVVANNVQFLRGAQKSVRPATSAGAANNTPSGDIESINLDAAGSDSGSKDEIPF